VVSRIQVKLFTLCVVVLCLFGCAHTAKDVMLDQRIKAPKVIAMAGSHAPWVYEIQKRLKKKGFKIKRMASQNVAIQKSSDTKTEIYNEASARFILRVDGSAPDGAMFRCFAGGWKFNYINVELIDVQTNEAVLHYSSSGYSENCPPLSGHIFTDIEEMVVNAWE